MTQIEMAYAGLIIVMGGVTFVLYAVDKRRAADDARRVPEKSLHLAELLGGWVGAIAARRVLRHKTRKLSFLVVSWAIAAAHGGLIIWWRWSQSQS